MQMNPLSYQLGFSTRPRSRYNQFVVAGFQDGESFLGYVDHHGTCYQEKSARQGRDVENEKQVSFDRLK